MRGRERPFGAQRGHGRPVRWSLGDAGDQDPWNTFSAGEKTSACALCGPCARSVARVRPLLLQTRAGRRGGRRPR